MSLELILIPALPIVVQRGFYLRHARIVGVGLGRHVDPEASRQVNPFQEFRGLGSAR